VRAGELFRVQLQVLERSVGGQHVKSIIEDLAHLLELLGRVELDVEFGKKQHELVERNLSLGVQLHHLLDYTAKFELLFVDELRLGGA
jgi:hypothetical protein